MASFARLYSVIPVSSPSVNCIFAYAQLRLNRFTRVDFPTDMQVGLVVNAYQGPFDLTAHFVYLDFQVPSPGNDCSSIPAIVNETVLEADLQFSDNFSNASLSDWSLLHLTENRAAQYSELNINKPVSDNSI